MKLSNKLKISLLITFFMTILLGIKVFAVTGVITEITVNLRKKPSTDSKRIMYVTQDDVVEVLEKDGEWYKIKAKGKTGYVFEKYIKVDDSKLEQKEETSNESQEEQEVKNEESSNEIQDVTTDVELKLQIKSKTDVRLIPNISSSIVYTSKKDISVDVIETIGDWTYVLVDNVYGWVRTDKVVEENQVQKAEKDEKTETTIANKEEENKEETAKIETKTAYIKYDTVNLREKPSTNSKTLAKLKLNDEVTVLEKINSVWSKVKVDGKTGYVSTDLLSDKKQREEEKDTNTTSRDSETTSRNENSSEDDTVTTTAGTKKEETTEKVVETVSKKEESTTSSKSKGEEIVDYAKKYLGYDYKYGGTSPKTGFDCSGFTYYVYKHFGYTISRSSTAQAKNGTKVAKKDLQPGDLLIYKNTSLTKIGHVGIYIGNNKMIHASEPGVGVVITDIDSKAHKYPQRYVTARRII